MLRDAGVTEQEFLILVRYIRETDELNHGVEGTE